MKKKKQKTAFDLMYTEEERKICVIEHAERIRLFQALKKTHPKLCKIPEEVYAVINHYIPDDFYERYAIAKQIEDKKHHRMLLLKKIKQIHWNILNLITSPNYDFKLPPGRSHNVF